MRWQSLCLGLAMLAATLPAGAGVDVVPPPPAAAPHALPFDTAHSRVGFQLATRWGQRLRGTFPAYEGEVVVHPDGRREVRVHLDTARMEITGHPRYTAWARGPEFFDAARFPAIEFRSETYDASLLLDGGPLHGTLTMRGIAQPVRFVVEPSSCDEPGRDCDVVAHGEVDRTDFGMDAWQVAVDQEVRFDLRVRTAGGSP